MTENVELCHEGVSLVRNKVPRLCFYASIWESFILLVVKPFATVQPNNKLNNTYLHDCPKTHRF